MGDENKPKMPVGEKMLLVEAERSNGFFNRFCTILEYIDEAMENEETMQWIYTNLRLHHLKQLRWYTKSARQPRDVGHIVNQLSMRMSTAAVFGKNPACRRLARMCIPYLSKGGGNGEQIRLEILAIMRRHGIKEGHRPGIDCKFLEQWHQKLHQNTTIEDIAVADAYIHFLETGTPGAFWWALWEWYQIPKDRLKNWATPITHDPLHLPQLINDMKHYRWILKTVHANDFGYLLETGKWALEKAGETGLVGELYEVLRNQSEWWVPGKIADVRHRLQNPMKSVYQGERDILMIDGALETTLRVQLEKQRPAETLDRDALIDIFDLILSQSSLSREYHPEWEGVLKQWRKMVKEATPRWTPEWCLRAKAAAERAGLLLAGEAEYYQNVLQPKAEAFARAVPEIDKAYILNFVEEIIRGQPSSQLSLILAKLEPQFREGAGMGKWQIVSAGRTGAATGEIMLIPDFAEVQGKSYTNGPPKIVFADKVGGNDDIPLGIEAVLAAGSADILSHVAIRARNQGVLLAYCDCTDTLNKLRGQHKEKDFVLVRLDATGNVELKEGHHATPAAGPGKPAAGQLAIPAPKPWPGYFLASADFAQGLVGGKSLHLKELSDALTATGGAEKAGIQLPRGFALPFGSFEQALGPSAAELAAKKGGAKAADAPASPAEALIRGIELLLKAAREADKVGSRPVVVASLQAVVAAIDESEFGPPKPEAAKAEKPKVKKPLPDAVEALAAEARDAHARGDPAAMAAALAELREDIVQRLEAPKEALAAVERIAEGLGVPADERPAAAAALWASVKRVWASKYTDRAVLSRATMAVPDRALYMAVLVQRVVPAQYAFVLHTAHPVTGDRNQVFGELVLGMGEALVGSYAGRALSFCYQKADGAFKILSFPSKRVGIFVPEGAGAALMARSDSNGEDLEDFAGAGLYDSVVSGAKSEERHLSYADEPLFWDAALRETIVKRLAAVGLAVEKAMGGSPQDVEGVWGKDGSITVVQTRPQVL